MKLTLETKINAYNIRNPETSNYMSKSNKNIIVYIIMLRPDSQPLTGFEAGTIEQAHAYYHADPLRSWQARLARRSIEQAHAYYHAPFYTRAHALDGSVSEVLRAIAFSLRRRTLLESV